MGDVIGILFGLMFAAIPLLIIGAIVYFILKFKGGTSINFSYRGALRVYFYVVTLVCVGLVVGGVSTLVKVGFGETIGREFSYGDVYADHERVQERILDCQRNVPEYSGVKDEYCPDLSPHEARSLAEKVEFDMKSSLINGISLTLIGSFLLLLHLFGRRWVETGGERSDLLRKLYLITGLAVFAVVTIAALTVGVPAALRYAVLEVDPDHGSPGEPLAVAIVALPVWITYLAATIRTTRS